MTAPGAAVDRPSTWMPSTSLPVKLAVAESLDPVWTTEGTLSALHAMEETPVGSCH
jgi:hypothetical protein